MKNLLVFILFVLIGFTGLILFEIYSAQRPATASEKKISPFSIDTPPSKSLRGEIATMSGELEWQSRSATEPAKLTQKREVLQGEEYWTKENGKMEFSFPDMVLISAENGTHINFIQTLPDHFVVVQDSGAAAYKMSSAAAPLSIRSHNLLIQQNSGEMTVNITNTIGVSVSSGSATLAFNNMDNTSNVVTVNQGEKYSFDTEKKEGKLTSKRE